MWAKAHGFFAASGGLQVLQNVSHFAFFSGSCSETEVSEQLY
jgi:hypothetical protein